MAITVITLAGGMARETAAYADESTGEVRAIDDSNNNLAHPDWGTPGSHLLREASGTHYADGISAMARPAGPSARAVSNAVFPQPGLFPNHLGISDYIWTFGQFLDHDFGLTEGAGSDGRTDAFISIPAFDVFFDPFGTGTQATPFHRGLFDPWGPGVTVSKHLLVSRVLPVYRALGFDIHHIDDVRALYGAITTLTRWYDPVI